MDSHTRPQFPAQYKSMVEFWNQWYNAYVHIPPEKFPWVIVRFEDLLFREEELVGELCSCVGGSIVDPEEYEHVDGAAKAGVGHDLGTNSSDRAASFARYSDLEARENSWRPEQLEWIEERLDWDLMEALGYKGALGVTAT